jgi:YVTN family beta-propeller protein
MPGRARDALTGIVALLLAIGTAGCGAGAVSPSPTPSPSLGPSSTPSATPIPTTTASPTPTPSPAPSLIAEQHVEDAGATRLTIGGFTDWVVAAEGDAWLNVGSDVRRLAGEDGAELASVTVPGAMCVAMDVGFGSVWVGSCEPGSPQLVRIDAKTTTITATIPLAFEDIQFEGSVGAGEGAVWVVSREPDDVLVKVDPASDAVVGTFPMPGGLAGVRAGYGAVWIAQPAEDAVLQVDPADGTVVRTIPTGPGPRFLAVGEGSVWSLNQGDGSVSRIDPATGSVLATIPTSLRGFDGGDIAVGCGLVWARISDVLVATIDPATNEVTARYGPAAGGGSVACADGAAWVTAEIVGSVWRLPVE